MKKIIIALTLMLAFSINANAQKKQVVLTPREKGMSEATELTKSLGLNETQNASISMILEQKHQTLEIKDLSDDRRRVLSEAIDAQIKSYLNADQLKKLEKNTDLHKKIIH